MDEYTKYHCKDPRLGQITVSVEKELHQSVHNVYDASSLTHSNASFKYFAYHTALDISSTHYVIFEHRIRQQIKIDDMQFGFLKGKGTTDAIFMARQMQENF